MYVIVVMRVNSPWRFLLFVDTSIVSTPLESSLAFTCLGFFSTTCSGRCSDRDSLHRWKWKSECEYTLHTDLVEKCTPHLKWGLLHRALLSLVLDSLSPTPYKHQRDRKIPCHFFQSPSVPRRNCYKNLNIVHCSSFFKISPRWEYVTISPYRLKPQNICLDSETNYVGFAYSWFFDFWFIDFFLWLRRKLEWFSFSIYLGYSLSWKMWKWKMIFVIKT